jgi:hypothetical protein
MLGGCRVTTYFTRSKSQDFQLPSHRQKTRFHPSHPCGTACCPAMKANHATFLCAATVSLLSIGCPQADPGMDAPSDGAVESQGDTSSPTTDADEELSRQLIAHFKSCDAYEPTADPSMYEMRDELDRCAAHCLLAESCTTFVTRWCSSNDDDSPLSLCLAVCPEAPYDGFRCASGDLIPHVYVCDLFNDCPDAEDERGCGEYRCSNGDLLPSKQVVCDGSEDCDDGSDEHGCKLVCTD